MKIFLLAFALFICGCAARPSEQPLKIAVTPTGYIVGSTRVGSLAEVSEALDQLAAQEIDVVANPEAPAQLLIDLFAILQKRNLKIGLRTDRVH